MTVEYDKSNLNIDYFDENDCQVKDSGRIKTWTGTQVGSSPDVHTPSAPQILSIEEFLFFQVLKILSIEDFLFFYFQCFQISN